MKVKAVIILLAFFCITTVTANRPYFIRP